MSFILLHFKRLFNVRATLAYYGALLILGTLLTLAFSSYERDLLEAKRVELGIINEDDHSLSGVLMESFKNNREFTTLFNITFGDQATIEGAFKTGTLDCYAHIPRGFTQGLLTYDGVPISLVGHVENPTINRLVSELIGGYAHYIDASNAATASLYFTMEKAGVTTTEKEKIHNSFSLEMIGATLGRSDLFTLAPSPVLSPVSSLSYFLLTLPLTFISFVTVQSALMAIQDQGKSTYSRLQTTGNRHRYIILCELVAQWLNTLVLMLPPALLILWVMPLAMASRALLALMVAALFWQSLWRFLRLFLPNESAFGLVASGLGFAMAIIGGGLVPYLVLPSPLKVLGAYTPHYLLSRFVFDGPVLSAGAPGALLALSLIFIALEFFAGGLTPKKGGQVQ